jgi:hypothetical protein
MPKFSFLSPRHGKRGPDRAPRRISRISLFNLYRHHFPAGVSGNLRGRPQKFFTKGIDQLYRTARSAELRKQIAELALTNPGALRKEARRFMRRGPHRQWR